MCPDRAHGAERVRHRQGGRARRPARVEIGRTQEVHAPARGCVHPRSIELLRSLVTGLVFQAATTMWLFSAIFPTANGKISARPRSPPICLRCQVCFATTSPCLCSLWHCCDCSDNFQGRNFELQKIVSMYTRKRMVLRPSRLLLSGADRPLPRSDFYHWRARRGQDCAGHCDRSLHVDAQLL